MRSKKLLTSFFLTFLSCSLFSSEFIVRDAKIYSTDSSNLVGIDLYIKDGKFISIGKDLAILGLKEIDAKGRYLTPGFLSPLSQIGLMEIELESYTRDDSSIHYSAGLGVSDAYNPSSTLVPYNLAGGITTSLSAPSFHGNLFAGLVSAFSLTGSLEKSLIEKDIALLANIKGGEDSRAANILMLQDAFDQARDYRINGMINEHTKPQHLNFSKRDLKAINRVLNKEIPLVVQANRASDLLVLISLAKRNNITLIISGAKEGWRVATQLSKAQVPVIIQPIDNLPSSFDEIGAKLDNASLLHNAGVKILIASHEPHNSYLSRQGAGIAVSYGLPWENAIDALSKNIAESFGLKDIGSIEVGKSADFIIWSDDPLEVSSFTDLVYIGGQEFSTLTRSARLKDRYIDR